MIDDVMVEIAELTAELRGGHASEVYMALSRAKGGGWIAEARLHSEPESFSVQGYGYLSPSAALTHLVEGLRENNGA